MKTRIFTFISASTICFFAACGSGNSTSGSATDSVKTDTMMPPATVDTAMKADTGMHKTDTSSLPK